MCIPDGISVVAVVAKMHDLAAARGDLMSLPPERRISLDEVCEQMKSRRDGGVGEVQISKSVSFKVFVNNQKIDAPDFDKEFGDGLMKRAFDEVLEDRTYFEAEQKRSSQIELRDLLGCLVLLIGVVVSGMTNAATKEYKDNNGIVWSYREEAEGIILENNTHPNGSYDLIGPNGTEAAQCYVEAVMVQKSYDLVCIPSNINGKAVIKIGHRAFSGCQINRMIIPASVREISRFAFNNFGFGYFGWGWAWYPSGVNCPKDILFLGELPSILYQSSVRVKNADWNPNDGGYNTYGMLGYSGFSTAYNDGIYELSTVWITDSCQNKVSQYDYAPVKSVLAVSAMPEDKAIISTTASVSLTSDEGVIYYTLDGSDPEPQETSVCHTYSTVIKLNKASTIKALVSSQNCPFTQIRTFSYAIAPAISIEGTFDKRNTFVSISGDSGVDFVRYTLDNTQVTEESPIYLVSAH